LEYIKIIGAVLQARSTVLFLLTIMSKFKTIQEYRDDLRIAEKNLELCSEENEAEALARMQRAAELLDKALDIERSYRVS
jgi:hypothetical protein